jgi:hypothetical protein
MKPQSRREAVAPIACAISPLAAIACKVASTRAGEGRIEGGARLAWATSCQASSSKAGIRMPSSQAGR